jgi:hypothetical protein
MMRASATILALLLLAGSALAQDAPQDAPVEVRSTPYSRDQLLRLFAAAAKQEGENPVKYDRGSVRFTALGTTWRFNYLPMMAMSGGRFGMTAVTQEWPDAFALTNTQIATPQRSWRTRREVNSELRRIEKSERAKVRVTVGGN